ncbi:MAG: glycosyltransferase family 4 protein [Flavobacteriales bacterium]|nr:glycosyltransferase family 4 protein [Flavobacteriales bacterium]
MALVINGRFLARPITGVERYGRLLLRVIAREWPDSRVIVPKGAPEEVDASGLEVVRLGNTSGHVWEQVELPRALANGDTLLSPANTGPLRAQRHVPVVHDLAFLHHPEWFNTRFATWYKLLIPRMVRRAERVITVSGTVRGELMRYYGADGERTHVVPPFVLPSLLDGHGRAAMERPYYLVVASLDPRKGIDRALNWYTGLRNAEFDLVIVGREHRAFSPVMIPEHPGIRVMKDVDDARLGALYRGAIALIQPSYYEGFGLPVLEAITLGCPVIGSYLNVFTEQFGDAVLVADIGYTRNMMRAMVTMNDPLHRPEWVEKGRQRSLTFTEERTTAALHDALDTVIHA